MDRAEWSTWTDHQSIGWTLCKLYPSNQLLTHQLQTDFSVIKKKYYTRSIKKENSFEPNFEVPLALHFLVPRIPLNSFHSDLYKKLNDYMNACP